MPFYTDVILYLMNEQILNMKLIFFLMNKLSCFLIYLYEKNDKRFSVILSFFSYLRREIKQKC